MSHLNTIKNLLEKLDIVSEFDSEKDLSLKFQELCDAATRQKEKILSETCYSSRPKYLIKTTMVWTEAENQYVKGLVELIRKNCGQASLLLFAVNGKKMGDFDERIKSAIEKINLIPLLPTKDSSNLVFAYLYLLHAFLQGNCDPLLLKTVTKYIQEAEHVVAKEFWVAFHQLKEKNSDYAQLEQLISDLNQQYINEQKESFHLTRLF